MGIFENGAVTGAFSRLFNDELHFEESGRTWNAWLRTKNALLRPFGLEDRIVIGEHMASRGNQGQTAVFWKGNQVRKHPRTNHSFSQIDQRLELLRCH